MSALPPISKFPEVDHADASGELASIYDDIQLTLRVPWVAFGIRAMSQFPAFVPAAWQMLRSEISLWAIGGRNGRDLEDRRGDGPEGIVAADEESLGVVPGDVFHVLAPEAGRGVAVG